MASKIEGPLDVSFRHNASERRWEWVLKEDLIYHVGHKNSADVLTIHPPATTDFASVPRMIRWIIPNWSRGHAISATFHDALYRGDVSHFSYVRQSDGLPDESLIRPTRKEADGIYREVNKEIAKFGNGMQLWQRLLAYWGVRLFGRRAYK